MAADQSIMLFPEEQLPFQFVVRPALGRQDFLVAECNQAAVQWVDLWPRWPGPLMVISGPAACGKTHLGAVWQAKSHAVKLSLDELQKASLVDVVSRSDHFWLDGIDFWLGDRESETPFFHLYNLVKEQQKTLLVTMRMTPSDVEFAVPDLASRFRSGLHARIEAPDDALLEAVLVKLFSDRRITPPSDIIHYIVPRMERSFRAAQALVEAIDTLAWSRKKPVTVSLARDAMMQLQAQE